MARKLSLFGALLLVLPTSALAYTNGWDMDEVAPTAHWRISTLNWAKDIHPDDPTFDDLLENYNPPAHEMWCHPINGYTDDPEDCESHLAWLDGWMRDYLELAPQESIPQAAWDAYPPECVSACFPTL